MQQPLDFHTHHAAFGAYGSFTLGAIGAGGGFNVHDGRRPSADEIYVGFGRASQGLRLLPFSQVSQADLSAFATSGKPSKNLSCGMIPESEVTRTLHWATDSWQAEGLRFVLATPFGEVPDPRMRGWEAVGNQLLPAVWGELEFDNTHSTEPAIVVFGMGGGDQGVVALEQSGIVGVTRQGRVGFATTANSQAKGFCDFSLDDALGNDLAVRTPHGLGSTFGLSWTVPAGVVGRFPIALGWYWDGLATVGLKSRYAYTRLWKNLEEVLFAAVACHGEALGIAQERDAELEDSSLSPERKWMLAHATRGYFGNMQVLATEGGDPVCIVNEGEYCMMNTLDLSVDQAFFEARFFPWFTREVLDLFADRHSFVDQLKIPGETRIYPGGISFSHDMGVRNTFCTPGNSSYERPNLEDCFSHMCFEQACNWPLTAAVYLETTGDIQWCEGRARLLEGVLESLERREHPESSLRQGVPGTDSSRCGTGTEITTYDSLDPSLAQTRQNLYSTVKLWASYLALERLLAASGRRSQAALARSGAVRSAKAVADWPGRNEILPAIADGRNASAILPALEGLVYPLYWKDTQAISPEGPFGAMVKKLGMHLEQIQSDKICRFKDGGWRISSTSENSWLSKIWIAQHVAERVYGCEADALADQAHLGWLAAGSSRWGYCDQIVHGKAIGSKYYPRGVTSILFLG